MKRSTVFLRLREQSVQVNGGTCNPIVGSHKRDRSPRRVDSLSPLLKHDIATKSPRRIRRLESGSGMTIDSTRSNRVDEMGTLTAVRCQMLDCKTCPYFSV